jgi:AcrR family transcriptional regulator
MERRKQGAIDEIARTALELFARDGFEATSVEAIAAAAGCSPRTFYRYFGSAPRRT